MFLCLHGGWQRFVCQMQIVTVLLEYKVEMEVEMFLLLLVSSCQRCQFSPWQLPVSMVCQTKWGWRCFCGCWCQVVNTVSSHLGSCRFPWSDRRNGGGDVFVVVGVKLSTLSVLTLAAAGLCGPTGETGVEMFHCCFLVNTVSSHLASCRFPWSDRRNGGGDVFVVVVVKLSTLSVLTLAAAGLRVPREGTGVVSVLSVPGVDSLAWRTMATPRLSAVSSVSSSSSHSPQSSLQGGRKKREEKNVHTVRTAGTARLLSFLCSLSPPTLPRTPVGRIARLYTTVKKRLHMHTHTHAHTRPHAHTHIHTHTHIYTHTHTHIHTHIRTHTLTHTHTHTLTCTHTYILTHTSTHVSPDSEISSHPSSLKLLNMPLIFSMLLFNTCWYWKHTHMCAQTQTQHLS